MMGASLHKRVHPVTDDHGKHTYTHTYIHALYVYADRVNIVMMMMCRKWEMG